MRSQRKYFGVMHVIDPSLGVQIYHFCKPVTLLPSEGPFTSQQASRPLAGSAKGAGLEQPSGHMSCRVCKFGILN